MKSMCKHWGLHISTNINRPGAVLGSFWAVWRGLLWCLKAKLISWRFPRYWRFNKRYHGGYQLICLISRPLLIASGRDWYRSKGLPKGFKLALRPWESSKNWWRYGQMKFVTSWQQFCPPEMCNHTCDSRLKHSTQAEAKVVSLLLSNPTHSRVIPLYSSLLYPALLCTWHSATLVRLPNYGLYNGLIEFKRVSLD